MRLATVEHDGGTYVARVLEDQCDLLPVTGIDVLLTDPGGVEWARSAEPVAEVPSHAVVTKLPVQRPSKILCIGLNYITYIRESGATPPECPTVFAKYRRALIADGEEIVLPAMSQRVDWEVELVVVVGKEVRNVGPREAVAAIAGFTVGNDIWARDLQRRTSQWLQGETCEATTPVGPWIATPDGTGITPDLSITCSADGVVRQRSRTSDLLFEPVDLVTFLSHIMTLEPGDLIFTGTPGGVGRAMEPPSYLAEGQTVTSSIEGIGSLINRCSSLDGAHQDTAAVSMRMGQ